jgi:NCS1 family nucleobase:cation symporter-1
MSDVHSVGGYVTAGSLFALGLTSWQVLISLLVGIVIVQFFVNLVAKPSQATGVPYPAICRAPLPKPYTGLLTSFGAAPAETR